MEEQRIFQERDKCGQMPDMREAWETFRVSGRKKERWKLMRDETTDARKGWQSVLRTLDFA